MNTTLARPTKHNVYAEMARHSMRALSGISGDLIADAPQSSAEIQGDAYGALCALWHRLAWSDRSLNGPECLVLELLYQEATKVGVELPCQEKFESPEEDPIPAFLRRVREHDRLHMTDLTESAMISIESFGYALLASDRKIGQAEIDALHDYMLQLRTWAIATHDA